MAAPAETTAKTSDYGRGAAVMSLGIGATGLVTFAYFFLASHNLSDEKYGEVALLWSAIFIIVSVLYRPIEQLLARTVAERQTRGESLGQPLRVAATIQAALAALFAVTAIALRSTIENELFNGNSTLFWVMFGSVLAYAVSYFARGLLAGSKRLPLYALLVFVEANSRVAFPLAVAIGIASGQTVVALGILAAPLFSLLVVPLALVRRSRASSEPDEDVVDEESVLDASSTAAPREEAEFTLAHGTGFAAAALLIMLCEQTFLNAGGLIVQADGGSAALAGYVFNALLIARAPLQLFQSISTSLLPHLSSLRADGDAKTYRHSVNVTLAAIAGFAGAVALVMLAAGPTVMDVLFGANYEYGRFGLVLVALGMGFYLAAATVNQASLAARKTGLAAACWIVSAAAFVIWMLTSVVENAVDRVEIGFFGASLLLFWSLYALYQATTPRTS